MDLAAHNRTMARNNCWSNHRLFHAMEKLAPGEFEAPRVSFFPSLKDTLNHILAIDRYYVDALTEGGLGPAAYRDFVAFDTLASLGKAQAMQDAVLIGFCDGLDSGELDRRVVTDRGSAGRFAERVGDLLAHLFVHQIHHRGQVHAMLSGTSVKPPQLDEFFLDYDLRFRKHEVETLGLGDQMTRTS